MTRTHKVLLTLAALTLLLLPQGAHAQATLTSTTLSAAVTSDSVTTINVASATGFAVNRLAFVDKEAMSITAVNGTTISVRRGSDGTKSATHASGVRVLVGLNHYFSTSGRSGSCTATSEIVLPVVNVATGLAYDCVNSEWSVVDRTLLAPRRSAGAYGRGIYIVDPSNSGFFDSSGSALKTFAVELSLTRTSGLAVTGDSNDAVIKGSYSNYAANDSNFQTRIYLGTMTNRSGGVVGVLNGAQFNASNKSGGTAATIVGLDIGTEDFGTNATEHGGIDVHVKDESGAATTSYGLRLRNIDQSNVAAIQTAILIPANSGNTKGWNYGVDLNGAVINTADLRLSSGVTVGTGTGVPSMNCGSGSIYLRSATGVASTVLYVCGATNTWTAITVP